jgi:outer membrane lipoprotein-sorting protein
VLIIQDWLLSCPEAGAAQDLIVTVTASPTRRIALSIFAFFLPLALGGAGQQAPQRLVEFTPQQQADLAKVSAYLNSIHTLKSNFAQLGPEGQIDQGTFYIARPGRMMFSYSAPSPVQVVATGGHLYVKNARLNTVDRYDLADTPLGILLDGNIDLARNKAVLGVDEQPGALIVRARTSANRSQANILLVFSFPQIELRQWVVRDNQGGGTTVALSGTETGMALDDTLFAIPVKAAKKSGG